MPVRLEITDRRPFAGGHEFGAAGAYERLSGRAHFTVDPDEPIVDLDRAPRDDAGLVHCTADFMLLVPRSGNRRLFFDYGNRGHKRALQFFNDAPHSNDPVALAMRGTGSCFATVTPLRGWPGRAISCRATGGWCWTFQLQRITASRSPGRCGSSISPTRMG